MVEACIDIYLTAEYIEELIKERNELLVRYPALAQTQFMVDKYLKEAGDNPLMRAEVAFDLLIHHLKSELIPAMAELENKKNNHEMGKITDLKKRFEFLIKYVESKRLAS